MDNSTTSLRVDASLFYEDNVEVKSEPFESIEDTNKVSVEVKKEQIDEEEDSSMKNANSISTASLPSSNALQLKTMTVRFNNKLTKLLFCYYCNKYTNDRQSMFKHYEQHVRMEDHKRFVCNRCSKRYISADLLTEHYNSIHHLVSVFIENPDVVKCKICSQVFSNGDELEEHYSNHSKAIDNMCHICFFLAFNEEKNLAHMTSAHAKNEELPCKKCGRCFTKQSVYEEHVSTDHYEFTSSCIYCHLQLAQRNQRECHFYFLHFCAFCSNTCSSFKQLKLHCDANHNILLILRAGTKGCETRAIDVEKSSPYLYMCKKCSLLTNCAVDITMHTCFDLTARFKALSIPKLVLFSHLWQSQRESFISRSMGILTCNSCGFETSSEHIMISHMNKHKPLYKCNFCHEYYISRALAMQHVCQVHRIEDSDYVKLKEETASVYQSLAKNTACPNVVGNNDTSFNDSSSVFSTKKPDRSSSKRDDSKSTDDANDLDHDDDDGLMDMDELFDILIPVRGNPSLIYCKVCCKKLSMRNPSVETVAQHLKTKDHVKKLQKNKQSDSSNIPIDLPTIAVKNKKVIDTNSEDVDDPDEVDDRETDSGSDDELYTPDVDPPSNSDSEEPDVDTDKNSRMTRAKSTMLYSQLHKQRNKKREFPVWIGRRKRKRDITQQSSGTSFAEDSNHEQSKYYNCLGISEREHVKAIKLCKERKAEVIIDRLPKYFECDADIRIISKTHVEAISRTKKSSIIKILSHRKPNMHSQFKKKVFNNVKSNALSQQQVELSKNRENDSLSLTRALKKYQSDSSNKPHNSNNSPQRNKETSLSSSKPPTKKVETDLLSNNNNPLQKESSEPTSILSGNIFISKQLLEPNALAKSTKSSTPRAVTQTLSARTPSNNNPNITSPGLQNKLDHNNSRVSQIVYSNFKKNTTPQVSSSLAEKGQLYKCDTCGFVSILLQNIFVHFETKHPNKKIIIPVEFEKQPPRAKKHSGYRCTKCQLTGSKSFMMKHLSTHSKYTCDICLFYTDSYQTMITHKKDCIGYICKLCSFSFKQISELQLHYADIHLVTDFKNVDFIYSSQYTIKQNEPTAPEEFVLE